MGMGELEFWVVSVGACKTNKPILVLLAVFFQAAFAAGRVFVILWMATGHF
jgi:hypothetical protein